MWGKDGFQKYFGENNSSVKSKWKYSVKARLEPVLVEDHSFSFHDPVNDNRSENSNSSSSTVIFWLWHHLTCKSYQACLFDFPTQ